MNDKIDELLAKIKQELIALHTGGKLKPVSVLMDSYAQNPNHQRFSIHISFDALVYDTSIESEAAFIARLPLASLRTPVSFTEEASKEILGLIDESPDAAGTPAFKKALGGKQTRRTGLGVERPLSVKDVQKCPACGGKGFKKIKAG